MVEEVLEICSCANTEGKFFALLLGGSRQVNTDDKSLALHLACQDPAWAWSHCCGSPSVLAALMSFVVYDHKKETNTPWLCVLRSHSKELPPLLSQGI